ncbi:hypothetical protein AC1031_002603 [Aphanomyces cochlioides]|nr:hypothetical protein AC1031_002603 [Aphanomyces cochlioides]
MATNLSSADDPSTALFPELAPYYIQHSAVQFDRPIHSSSEYSEVWLGQYNNDKVAMQCSRPSREAADRLSKDIQVMARLHSPYIVRFLGATWTAHNDLSAVVEYMPRRSLRHLLRVEALAYLHGLSRPLILSTLTSKRVLLADTMAAKLSVFRLDRKIQDEARTLGSVPPYTDRWLAPEVLKEESFTDRADVYSFGRILCELDTREIPHGKGDNTRILLGVVTDNLKPTVLQTCPKPIRRLVEACVEHNPILRPSSSQVVEILEQAKLELNQPTSSDVVEASEIV